MCQLLGMNCNTPTDIVFSFEGFRQRGGKTGQHTDGFGIAFFEGKGFRLFTDNHPSINSPIAQLIHDYPIKSVNVIAHIRKASQGHSSLVNTHPFVREIWGEYWIFAHNGQLRGFDAPKGHCYIPVGESDSEELFCYFLETLKQKYGDNKPTTEEIFNLIYELAAGLEHMGILNFLISNGKWMLAYANTLLFYRIRRSPFGEVQLVDEDMAVDFSQVTTPNDKVAVITTIPLTANEEWTQLAKNELLLFRDGEVVLSRKPEAATYLSIDEGIKLARAYSVY